MSCAQLLTYVRKHGTCLNRLLDLAGESRHKGGGKLRTQHDEPWPGLTKARK